MGLGLITDVPKKKKGGEDSTRLEQKDTVFS